MAEVRFQLDVEKPRFFKSKPHHKDQTASRSILKSSGEYEDRQNMPHIQDTMADARIPFDVENPRFFKSKPHHEDQTDSRSILKSSGEYEDKQGMPHKHYTMADAPFQLAADKPRFFKSKPHHKDQTTPRSILKAPGEYDDRQTPLSASNRHHDSRHGSKYPQSTAIPSSKGVIPYQSLLTPHYEHSSSSDHSTSSDIRLNSFLSDPRFTWNISLPSTTATYPSRLPNLQLPATEPPTHKLTLRFSLPHPDFSEIKQSWSPLIVRARDSKRVTTRDILDATYSYFQTTLKFHEYNNLPLDAYNDLIESYTRRLDCQKHGSYLGQDPKREDVLLGNTSFHGLKLSSVKDGEIKFSLLLGPSIY